MFDYLFSPHGSIGRGAYWGAQFIYILVGLAFVTYLSVCIAMTAQNQPHQKSALSPPSPGHLLTPQEQARAIAYLEKEINEHPGPFMTGGFVLLCLLWSSFAVEIKRWHNRGFSGFFVLRRFVPWLFYGFGPHVYGAVTAVISLGAFIQLGLLGESYAYHRPPERELARERSSSGNNILVTVLVLLLLGVVAAWFVMSRPKLPASSGSADSREMATVSAASATTSSVAPAQTSEAVQTPKLPPLTEASYHGTGDANFGTSWIMVKGQKIEGILAVNPAPHAEIAIVYKDGGRDIPVSSVPQGFLDAWNLTPERLKALDAP